MHTHAYQQTNKQTAIAIVIIIAANAMAFDCTIVGEYVHSILYRPQAVDFGSGLVYNQFSETKN